jgi:hypothetical protein
LGHSFARSDSDSQALLSGGFPSTALMMLSEWEAHLDYLMIVLLVKLVALASGNAQSFQSLSVLVG